ncbi:toxin HipA [Fibrobacterales bacterium]|nr:toxin HipA [Fibrobacterales bacterium]
MIVKAEVFLWNIRIAAVIFDETTGVASFQYDPDFIGSSIEVSPVKMPLSNRVYSFNELPYETFNGLPGLLSDSLPDKFGNELINEYLAAQGRTSMNPVEKLCYIGSRGMGALEYKPATNETLTETHKIELEPLVQLASRILVQKHSFSVIHKKQNNNSVMQQILSIGTSAGGARAKALIAWNQKTNEIRSGQVSAGKGFTYWLLKFDIDFKGYGLVEYAYYLMATNAGITMSESRLFSENNRHHFMTKRFDRSDKYEKKHLQTLGALAHFDFNSPASYSYEQAIFIMKNNLHLTYNEIEQFFRRMAFNIIARNQDDHVKNIAFLMDKKGRWSLSPAYDITYNYNPKTYWTNQHQMSMNGKRDNFVMNDFIECGKTVSLKRGRAEVIVNEVLRSVSRWQKFAKIAGVEQPKARKIQSAFRVQLSR